MTGSTIEIGSRVAGRYRFDEPLRDAGWWLGTDEALHRRTEIAVVPATDSRATRLLAAARATAVLPTSRFAGVLDATVVEGLAVVVTEHVAGVPLLDRLLEGPLSWTEAARLVTDCAVAMADAHDAGVVHGHLTPEHVVLTVTGPRITGLALASVVAGQEDPTPADDERALGALLAGSLTARWPQLPGLPATALPAGPHDNGRPLSPRQLRAGVPAGLDALARRVLGLDLRVGSRVRPLAASQLATALTALLPEESPPPERTTGLHRGVTALGLVAVVAAGWLVGQAVGRLPPRAGFPALPPPVVTGPDFTPAATTPGAALTPVSVRDFDPYGDGTEGAGSVRLAHDGDPTTAWRTNHYRSRPDLGGLKPGVGLLVDLGPDADVGTVTLRLVGSGTDLELRAGDSTGERTGERTDSYTVVASAAGAGQAISLTPSRHRARYWLIWLTRLPPNPPGFRGGIAELAFLRRGIPGS